MRLYALEHVGEDGRPGYAPNSENRKDGILRTVRTERD